MRAVAACFYHKFVIVIELLRQVLSRRESRICGTSTGACFERIIYVGKWYGVSAVCNIYMLAVVVQYM